LRNISLGALVRPGDVITTLDDDSVMKLDMSVPSTYLPYLQTGLLIKAKAHALGGRIFEGQISSIGSRVDPVTRSVLVRALIPNPEQQLRPGLLMVVELKEPARTAVVVPEISIIKSAGETFVFVVQEESGKQVAVKRIVEQGQRQSGVVEVTEGLAQGEIIVTQGHLKLKHGAEVNVSAWERGTENLDALLHQEKNSTHEQHTQQPNNSTVRNAAQGG
jgi:membrane fusion protein, multidrug efflux system